MAEHRLSGLTAPSISDIEELAAEAFRSLPEDFREVILYGFGTCH